MWNRRYLSGHLTRLDPAEFDQLAWRTIAFLLETFDDKIAPATSPTEIGRYAAELAPDGEVYGPLLTGACLTAVQEVYHVTDREQLRDGTERARKSNLFYLMSLDVWNEVIGVCDAPPASPPPRPMEERKFKFAKNLHVVLFQTRARIVHKISAASFAILPSRERVVTLYNRVRLSQAKRGANAKSSSMPPSSALQSDIRTLGALIGSLLPTRFASRVLANSRESIHMHGTHFVVPWELARLGDQTLATMHIMQRTFAGAGRPPRRRQRRQPTTARLLYVSDPSGTLPFDSVEAAFFSGGDTANVTNHDRHSLSFDMR